MVLLLVGGFLVPFMASHVEVGGGGQICQFIVFIITAPSMIFLLLHRSQLQQLTFTAEESGSVV